MFSFENSMDMVERRGKEKGIERFIKRERVDLMRERAGRRWRGRELGGPNREAERG